MIISIVLVIKLLWPSSKSMILYAGDPKAKLLKTNSVLCQLAPCQVQPVVDSGRRLRGSPFLFLSLLSSTGPLARQPPLAFLEPASLYASQETHSSQVMTSLQLSESQFTVSVLIDSENPTFFLSCSQP